MLFGIFLEYAPPQFLDKEKSRIKKKILYFIYRRQRVKQIFPNELNKAYVSRDIMKKKCKE